MVRMLKYCNVFEDGKCWYNMVVGCNFLHSTLDQNIYVTQLYNIYLPLTKLGMDNFIHVL